MSPRAVMRADWRVYVLIFASAWIGGCKNGNVDEPDPAPEPVEEEQKTICFSQSIVTETEQSCSRADDDETAQLRANGMTLWGYKTLADALQTVMDGYDLKYTASSAGSTTTNTNDWEYVFDNQTIKYWDDNATDYRFMGVSAANGITVAPTLLPDAATATSLQLSYVADVRDKATCPYYSRLNLIEDPTTHPVVTMKFVRPLCQVKFYFTNEAGEHLYVLAEDEIINGVQRYAEDVYTIVDNTKVFLGLLDEGVKALRNITLSRSEDSEGNIPVIPVIGNVTVTYPLTDTGSESCNSTPIDDSGYAALTVPDYPYRLFPTEAGDLTLSVCLNSSNTPRIATVPAEYCRWQPNYRYTYRFKVVGNEVEYINVVQVGITAWETDTDDREHDFYNW